MYFYRFLSALLLAATCIFSGCGLHKVQPLENLPATDIELTDTPFFAQETYQCGPAALASLLVSSDAITLPEMLVPELYIPGRKGSLQLDIIGSIRRHNRIPYVIKPDIQAVSSELQAGRPVLVLQNLGLKIAPVYHYSVIVGMRTDGRLILRSGTTERKIMTISDFLSTWNRAGNWGVVSLRQNELPADHDIDRYLKAVASIEAAGNLQLAEQAYTNLLFRHPNNATATFGLANTLFSQNQFTAAASFYQYLLEQDPYNAAAANNLAETLAAMKCYNQAIELIDTFL
jgi:hypothetical protein